MMAFIWAVVRPYALKIGLALAVVLTILAVLARVKQAGRTQERLEQANRQAKIRQRQEKTMAKSPRTKKEIIGALEKGTF